MTVEASVEKHEFQAEVRQVLDLMIHSLYSNKEIFLRELISNASDACDKLRFEALQQGDLYEDDTELKIEVDIDKDARTLTIRDNGIGMSRAEVIDNIGTIARSGTRKYLESLSGDQQQDAQLIGQFGVGFYSSFIIADKVTLTTRRAGLGAADGVRWISTGEDYQLEDVDQAPRGTEIVLHLKEGEDEYLQPWQVRSVITRYSDHIGFPIMMPVPEQAASAGDDKAEPEENEEVIPEWEAVNKASALWTLPKAEISDEDYQSFYKHIAHDMNDALSWAHNKVEGNQSYTSLVYIPAKAPFDMHLNRDEVKGLKLYVKRVFIMDAAEQLLPNYLRFVRGIVDSDDLPLNVSREILQENSLVKSMRSALVKRSLGLLDKLAKNDAEQYQCFWGEFGEVLKEGVVEDFSNREKVAKLLRFSTTQNPDKQEVGLEEYLARMKSGQEHIYYVTADNHQAALNSPHLEIFNKYGIEVLLLSDRVDEWMMGYFHEFDGKSLKSIAKGDIDLSQFKSTEDEDEDADDGVEDAQLAAIKKVLEDSVDEVRVSKRLTDSAACLVLGEGQMALHMQRLMKQAGQAVPTSKPVLEINAEHPFVQSLLALPEGDQFADWSKLLFEQASLAEGGDLADLAGFSRRLNGLLKQVSGLK